MTSGDDVPIAVPVAWSSAPETTRSHRKPASTGATTTSRSLRPSQSRVGRWGLAAVAASLSARDWEVLRAVAAHRYLATRQIEDFLFHDHATALTGARVCRRILHRLEQLGVLAHLDRRVGGVRAGSASYVWQVGPVGDRLLRADTGIRKRRHEPGHLFLGHCLAVADGHLALVLADRAGDIELVEVALEPDCWRRYVGLGGARLVLQPDLYVVTGDPTDSNFVNRWFVEVDRGTENPARLLDKCARYETYRRTGTEQANAGSFPLVIWVMASDAHADRLRAAIQRDGSLDADLYRITTAERFIQIIRGGAS